MLAQIISFKKSKLKAAGTTLFILSSVVCDPVSVKIKARSNSSSVWPDFTMLGNIFGINYQRNAWLANHQDR